MMRMLSRRPTTTRTGLPIVDTSIWGPLLWTVLHTVAARSPASWAAIPAALRISLPCPDCDAHFNAWCDARPPPSDAAAASQWLLDLHNNVNSRKGVPTWTPAQLAARYAATPEGLAEASAALQKLTGIIGAPAHEALTAALV